MVSGAFREGVLVKWAGTSATEGRDCAFPMILDTPPHSHTHTYTPTPPSLSPRGEEGSVSVSLAVT